MNFRDTADMWQFCGSRILIYKWERLRVLAETEAEHDILNRIEEKLIEELRKDASQGGDYMIVQTAGADRYASPVIGGRWQVLESFIKGTFYVCDHKLDDLLVRMGGKTGDVQRFPSIAAAENYIAQFVTDFERYRNSDSEPITEKEPDTMARPVTSAPPAAPAPVAQAPVEPKRRGRPPKAVQAAPEPVAQAPVPVAEPKRRGRPPKAVAPVHVPYSSLPTIVPPAEEPAAPKRRGRPPKAALLEPVAPAAPPVQDAPKRRGRPPKAVQAAPVAAPVPFAPAVDAPKRRGRPPKVREILPTPVQGKLEIGMKITGPKGYEGTIAAVTPPRRGRPPKVQETAPVAAPPAEPKRRGRPPKAVQAVPAAPPVAAEPKRRGRPPKVAVPAAVVANPATPRRLTPTFGGGKAKSSEAD